MKNHWDGLYFMIYQPVRFLRSQRKTFSYNRSSIVLYSVTPLHKFEYPQLTTNISFKRNLNKHSILQLTFIYIRYDTIQEFNMNWKAEYSALSSTRSQKKKLKQTTPTIFDFAMPPVTARISDYAKW